jgi:hypothetical protein
VLTPYYPTPTFSPPSTSQQIRLHFDGD